MCNCCVARVLPREVELVPELNRSAVGEVQSGLSGPTDWILRYIKTCLHFFECICHVAAFSHVCVLCVSVFQSYSSIPSSVCDHWLEMSPHDPLSERYAGSVECQFCHS